MLPLSWQILMLLSSPGAATHKTFDKIGKESVRPPVHAPVATRRPPADHPGPGAALDVTAQRPSGAATWTQICPTWSSPKGSVSPLASRMAQRGPTIWPEVPGLSRLYPTGGEEIGMHSVIPVTKLQN